MKKVFSLAAVFFCAAALFAADAPPSGGPGGTPPSGGQGGGPRGGFGGGPGSGSRGGFGGGPGSGMNGQGGGDFGGNMNNGNRGGRNGNYSMLVCPVCHHHLVVLSMPDSGGPRGGKPGSGSQQNAKKSR